MQETIDFMKKLDENGELEKYFDVACNNKISKLDDFINLFYNYLSSRKTDCNDYKNISCHSFNNYILKLKYGRWF